jgi:hypothetical protein
MALRNILAASFCLLKNITFKSMKDRHVDDRGASLAGTLGNLVNASQQFRRDG